MVTADLADLAELGRQAARIIFCFEIVETGKRRRGRRFPWTASTASVSRAVKGARGGKCIEVRYLIACGSKLQSKPKGVVIIFFDFAKVVIP